MIIIEYHTLSSVSLSLTDLSSVSLCLIELNFFPEVKQTIISNDNSTGVMLSLDNM